jgi:hypothetical protein
MKSKPIKTIEKETKALAWGEQKRLGLELKMSRDVNKLARDIDAVGIIAIAFFPEGEYCHQLESGCGMIPHTRAEIYRRAANAHDRRAEFGEHFDPESKGRHFGPIKPKCSSD